MKKALIFMMVITYFMVPTHTLAAINQDEESIISDYTEQICHITH